MCVGIGSTKTKTKFANHLVKKNPCFDGVCDLDALSPTQQDEWMMRIEVGEVRGVGRHISKKLAAMGIETVQDLKTANPELIRGVFSVVFQKTVQELQGCSCLPLEMMVRAKQQIMSSRSFGKPVHELSELK